MWVQSFSRSGFHVVIDVDVSLADPRGVVGSRSAMPLAREGSRLHSTGCSTNASSTELSPHALATEGEFGRAVPACTGNCGRLSACPEAAVVSSPWSSTPADQEAVLHVTACQDSKEGIAIIEMAQRLRQARRAIGAREPPPLQLGSAPALAPPAHKRRGMAAPASRPEATHSQASLDASFSQLAALSSPSSSGRLASRALAVRLGRLLQRCRRRGRAGGRASAPPSVPSGEQQRWRHSSRTAGIAPHPQPRGPQGPGQQQPPSPPAARQGRAGKAGRQGRPLL